MNENVSDELVRLIKTGDILPEGHIVGDENIRESVDKALRGESPELMKLMISGLLEVRAHDHDKKQCYEKLGHLARQFQLSLKEFADSLGPRLKQEDLKVSSVRSQIEAVLEVTKESSMNVLALAEQQLAYPEQLSDIGKCLGHLAQNPAISNDDREKMLGLKDRLSEMSVKLDSINSEVIISQGFQDITGQVLNKIEYFVSTVESGILEMIKMLVNNDIDNELAQIDLERLETNCSQDDVNDLLASLGF